jgi:hypothetical protein
VAHRARPVLSRPQWSSATSYLYAKAGPKITNLCQDRVVGGRKFATISTHHPMDANSCNTHK